MDDQMVSVIRRRAEHLIAFAQAAGVVVTIETRARQPLAMGNYAMVADARLARQADPKMTATRLPADDTEGGAV